MKAVHQLVRLLRNWSACPARLGRRRRSPAQRSPFAGNNLPPSRVESPISSGKNYDGTKKLDYLRIDDLRFLIQEYVSKRRRLEYVP
ncbi:1-deoxy-D-xylulose 5-phosphate reductoisomerase [Frankliniella fusca]|uniref:1-deoxy-D-xylulose 5-phosphate reductoisomerase n=1 Tax=Frankliniella fusca TaxID=407009 RepID=A0AAE1HYV7_9NEOP|nr:1-deoxy-D-xylulose 5-phosphate reductoisomerase [Frankliniella fusca]